MKCSRQRIDSITASYYSNFKKQQPYSPLRIRLFELKRVYTKRLRQHFVSWLGFFASPRLPNLFGQWPFGDRSASQFPGRARDFHPIPVLSSYWICFFLSAEKTATQNKFFMSSNSICYKTKRIPMTNWLYDKFAFLSIGPLDIMFIFLPAWPPPSLF